MLIGLIRADNMAEKVLNKEKKIAKRKTASNTYCSNGKSYIFISVMIIDVNITSSSYVHIKQAMRSKLLSKRDKE